MNAEMIQAGVVLAGTVLSFMFLLRARRLAAELWPAISSSQCLPIGRDVACPVEMNQEFSEQER
jgi:hypothetical protein